MSRSGMSLLADRMFDQVGDIEFTFAYARQHTTGLTFSGATLFGLYNMKILERADGLKRSPKGRKPPQVWRFTARYRESRRRMQERTEEEA